MTRPTLIDVRGCWTCPACDIRERECALADERYIPEVLRNAAPDWCPLRSGPVTIRLREDGDE